MTSTQSRRRFLASLAHAAASAAFYNGIARAQGDRAAAGAAEILAGAGEAARLGRSYRLPPGVTTIHPLALPDGAHLVGAKGGSILRLASGGSILSNAAACEKLTLENIVLDGAGLKPRDPARGLLHFERVQTLRLHGVTIRNAAGVGVSNIGSGGEVLGCAFRDIGDAAYHSLDGLGVTIDGNVISACGNAGVRIWTNRLWAQDGSRVLNNRISEISANAGGTGQNGNGVNIFRAGGVTVDNNVVRKCAFSAVRNNSGRDFVATRNVCSYLGERAMYAEFDFRDSIFRDNVIEDCAGGISAVNYVGPGDGDRALIEGNFVSIAGPPHPDDQFRPRMNWASGVQGEGNARIRGNTVVGSPWVGIVAGFYAARENVTVEANKLIDNEYAIGFATQDGVGPCSIAGNAMRGSKKANIVAMFQEKVVSGDLASPGARLDYKGVILRDNRVG